MSTEGDFKRKSFGYMQSIECIVCKIAAKNEVFFNSLQQIKSNHNSPRFTVFRSQNFTKF